MVTSSIYCNSFRLKAGILFMVSYIPTFFKKIAFRRTSTCVDKVHLNPTPTISWFQIYQKALIQTTPTLKRTAGGQSQVVITSTAPAGLAPQLSDVGRNDKQ